MNALFTTLGGSWNDQCLIALVLLHTLLGYDTALAPTAELTPEVFAQTLQRVVAGNYSTADYSKRGAAPLQPPRVQPPPVNTGARYVLIALNARTPSSQQFSIAEGGVIFEDPIWAVLAAHALFQNEKLALPLASGHEELWKRTKEAQVAIMRGAYKPEQFLGPIAGFVAQTTSPKFEIVTVSGEQILALRQRGLQALKVSTPPKLFQLYQPPPKAQKAQ